jgi:hypothetical protein
MYLLVTIMQCTTTVQEINFVRGFGWGLKIIGLICEFWLGTEIYGTQFKGKGQKDRRFFFRETRRKKLHSSLRSLCKMHPVLA